MEALAKANVDEGMLLKWASKERFELLTQKVLPIPPPCPPLEINEFQKHSYLVVGDSSLSL